MSSLTTIAPSSDAKIIRIFLLDRSGSMETTADDTVGGFNAFVEEQKEFGGTLSLYQFDHEILCNYQHTEIANVPRMDRKSFIPRGSTALLDAIGEVMKAQSIPENAAEQGISVKFVILTDGLENASHKYTSAHIKDLIEMQTKKGWDFMYLGANQDAIMEAGKMGICAQNVMNFDAANTGTAFRALSATMSQQARGLATTLSQQPEATMAPPPAAVPDAAFAFDISRNYGGTGGGLAPAPSFAPN